MSSRIIIIIIVIAVHAPQLVQKTPPDASRKLVKLPGPAHSTASSVARCVYGEHTHKQRYARRHTLKKKVTGSGVEVERDVCWEM